MEEVREIKLAKFQVWRNNDWVTVRLAEIKRGEVFTTNNNKLDDKFLVARCDSYLNERKIWEIKGSVYDSFDAAVGR